MKIELSEEDVKRITLTDSPVMKIIKTEDMNLFCDRYWICHLPGSNIIDGRILIFSLCISLPEFILNSILNKFISVEDYKRMIVADPGGKTFYKLKLDVKFEKM